ncbi:MAG: hypothetical protein RI904_2870, partial [Pseudomonadota bacterium]
MALGRAKSELALYLEPVADGTIRGVLEYDASLFKESRVLKWSEWLLRTFDQVHALRHSDIPVDTLSLVESAERDLLISAFNNVTTAYPSNAVDPSASTLCVLFEQQAHRTPDAVALVCADEELSYSELDQRANQLARHLIAQGVGPDQVVAILLGRSPEMIVAMLATLKAGAAYLPLDPTYPIGRLSFMLIDSGSKILISTNSILDESNIVDEVKQNLADYPPGYGADQPLTTLSLDDYILEIMLDQYADNCITDAERSCELHPRHLAYLIYTSGSTGTPKGAGNTHESAVNLVQALKTDYQQDTSSRVLQLISFAFDASFSEIMPALCSGAS